jgi:uncharacterized membrane protein YeaQ/YmgE (transglycosylase-associated protein family)
MFINLICWIVVGLIVGFIGSKMFNQGGDDPMLGILLAAGGAAVGGFVFSMFSSTGISNFNLASLWVAVVGAVGALGAWYSIRKYSRA